MSDLDLATALNMFKEGAQTLSFRRALDSANEQVQQIKSSEANEQQQRAQLQQLSNGLVTHMAGIGIPATTIQAVSGAIAPQQYHNSNQMAAQAVLTGNSDLLKSAKELQGFEQNPEFKKELLNAKALVNDPLRKQAAKEQETEFDIKQFGEFSKDLDKSAASSRSAFGQWAGVEGRGQRLNSILGDSSTWKNMTADQLELVKEGVVQMSKGGAMTESEHKALSPFMLKVKKAQIETAATGKPTTMDLSAYASLYSDIIKREGDVATNQITKTILTRATGKMKLYDRDPEQFKVTIAERLRSQAGLSVAPEDIIVDKKKGVSIAPNASTSSASAPNAMTPVMVRDKTTGKLIRALKDASGKLYPAN